MEAGNAWLGDYVTGGPSIIQWDDGLEGYQILRRSVLGQAGGAGKTGISVDAEHLTLTDIISVSAHEFGHMRGINHHDGPGVMNPIVGPHLEWTPADQTACEEVGACR